MKRWPVSGFLGVSAVLVLLGTSRAVEAEEPETEQATESPQAVQGAASFVRPGYYLGYAAGRAYVVPSARPYRRGALPAAVGVYVGPRTYYAGILAPWGSFPAALYAASIPLPQLAARPGDDAGYPYGQGVTVYRPPMEPTPRESSTVGPERPTDRSTVPEGLEPATGPETIPAPRPMDVPNSGRSSAGPSGGLINPTPQANRGRPAVRATPSRVPESGPREF